METNRTRLLAVGGIVALVVAVTILMLRGDRSRDLVLKVEPVSGNDQITVYAGGAVATPGLYTLPRGSRVASLVDRAGLLDDADSAALQMAAELQDGQQIIVPTRVPASAAPAIAQTGGSPVAAPSSSTGPVNINTASIAQLDQLPGIGPALAQRIVDYRTAHGPFATVDALAAVQGISDRMVQDLGALITVGP